MLSGRGGNTIFIRWGKFENILLPLFQQPLVIEIGQRGGKTGAHAPIRANPNKNTPEPLRLSHGASGPTAGERSAFVISFPGVGAGGRVPRAPSNTTGVMLPTKDRVRQGIAGEWGSCEIYFIFRTSKKAGEKYVKIKCLYFLDLLECF